MNRKLIVNTPYTSQKKAIEDTINNFDAGDVYLGNPNRNIIKVLSIDGKKRVVKSFKIPNIINQVAYRHLRKSKAERSYLYANTLLEKGIDTPYPIAYFTETSALVFKRSFYISDFLDYDLTYRELTNDFTLKDYDEILRGFTRFTYKLHENQINFLDHSPGNTLIKKVEGEYRYFLVDLNRMEFGEMDLETRIKNFSKLTTHKSMVKIMSDEYAKCSGEDYETIYSLMWKSTLAFQEKFHRKKKMKAKLLFWRAKK